MSPLPPLDIPFNKPFLTGNEITYLADSVASGHISGDGKYTKRCNQLIEQIVPGCRAMLTTSCTHALEMAALLIDPQPGDEIIVPSFTFVSTANAFALRGARLIFADIRPDTLNLDERQLPGLITPRTRAIVPVHYAGVGCEMDSILKLARENNIAVIEDNAHGFLGRYRGRPLGTFGELATQSFHETKNFSCGEGGALLVNKPELLERAEIIREKGTNRARYFRGMVDKYTWVDLGSSYLPSDLLAAYLYAQLEAREAIQARRCRIWTTYRNELEDWARRNQVGMPFVPEHCEQPFHMFYLLLPSLEKRQALIAHLRARGILAVFHYAPLHLSEVGRRFGGRDGQCPVTEHVSDRLLRLPFYFELSDSDQQRVIESITSSAV